MMGISASARADAAGGDPASSILRDSSVASLSLSSGKPRGTLV